MPTNTLDHIAIRVTDRDAAAAELVDRFDMRVIERTDRFTLVGPDFAHGKITLLDAEAGTEPRPNRIVSVVLAEADGHDGGPPVHLRSGMVVTFAGAAQLGSALGDVPRHSLVGVNIRTLDPPLAAAMLEAEHGMRIGSVKPDVAVMAVGNGPLDGQITLAREDWEAGVDAMLDHIGVRVDDAEACRHDLEARGAEVLRFVDAPHSRAVFVAGPEQLVLEFVEHVATIDG